MRYKVHLKKTEDGYAIWCLNLPSCWSQGDTEEEALVNIKDAIQIYLETREQVKLYKDFDQDDRRLAEEDMGSYNQILRAEER